MTRLVCTFAIGTIAISALGGPAAASAGEGSIEPAWFVEVAGDTEWLDVDDLGVVVTARDGVVTAIDPEGRSMWEAQVTAGDESVLAPPAIDGELVAVAVGEQRVLAIDRGSGRVLWKTPLADVAVVDVDQTAAGSDVVAVTRGGTMTLLSGADGAQRWSIALPPEEDRPELRAWHAGSRVVVAWMRGIMHVLAFDVSTGQPAWSMELDHGGTTPAVLEDLVVMAVNTRREHKTRYFSEVRGYDLASGAIRWTSPEVRGVFFPTFVTDATARNIVVADLQGRLTLLRRDSGEIVWRRPTHRRQYENEPLIIGSTVAMTTYGSGLVALATRDGGSVYNASPGRGQVAVTFNDAAAGDGRLYLLGHRLPTGAGEVWMLQPGG